MSFEELLYKRAVVNSILDETSYTEDNTTFYQQTLEVKLDTDELVEVEVGSLFQPLTEAQRLSQNQQIIVGYTPISPGEYLFIDTYRLSPLYALLGLFVLIVLLVARMQGLRALFGILLTLALLIWFIVPGLLQGYNPIVLSLASCVFIGGVSMYFTHGLGKISHLSFASLILTLSVSVGMAWASIVLMNLSGGGSEEAGFLRIGETSTLNLQGLLLGGIILGLLGVLDDIIVSQVEVVMQLKLVKSSIKFPELVQRGLAVGRRHVSSLVNTLVLAYAGTNLPLFLLFSLYNTQPIWVVLNSELLMEEMVRTLVGSIGLILSVPITTFLAAWFLSNSKQKDLEKEVGDHAHSHSHSHSH